MNDFERQLARQQFRPLPKEWRDTIVGSPAAVAAEETPQFSWIEWLWPGPRAWAAVAALWIIVLAVAEVTSEPAAPHASAADAALPVPSSLYALGSHELRHLIN